MFRNTIRLCSEMITIKVLQLLVSVKMTASVANEIETFKKCFCCRGTAVANNVGANVKYPSHRECLAPFHLCSKAGS